MVGWRLFPSRESTRSNGHTANNRRRFSGAERKQTFRRGYNVPDEPYIGIIRRELLCHFRRAIGRLTSSFAIRARSVTLHTWNLIRFEQRLSSPVKEFLVILRSNCTSHWEITRLFFYFRVPRGNLTFYKIFRLRRIQVTEYKPTDFNSNGVEFYAIHHSLS